MSWYLSSIMAAGVVISVGEGIQTYIGCRSGAGHIGTAEPK
jgi:hypothetical protein